MVIATSIATTPMRAPEVTDDGIVPPSPGTASGAKCRWCGTAPGAFNVNQSLACAIPTHTAVAVAKDPREAYLKRDNHELVQHHRAAARASDPAAWTHEVDAGFSMRPRDGLRAALARLGFDFR
jgi:hypothetical protein